MKERIVIEKELLEKIIKASPIQWFDNKEKTDKIVIFGKEYETMQVPETWEDVKQLTKELIEKLKLNKEIWEIKIEEEFIYVRRKWETKEICFTSVGNMVSNNGWDLLMTNLTPPRQWQIIKNLIGEE